jgi:hypothetical protein
VPGIFCLIINYLIIDLIYLVGISLFWSFVFCVCEFWYIALLTELVHFMKVNKFVGMELSIDYSWDVHMACSDVSSSDIRTLCPLTPR